MRYKNNNFRIRKACIVAIFAVITTLFVIVKSDKTVVQNKKGTVYNAAITDSTYSVVDEGFAFDMVGQGNGLNCYAFSSTKAMEATLFKRGYGIVNFSEPHMTTFVKNLGRSYEGALTWDDVWLAYLEPVNGPYEEGSSQINYKANNCTHIDASLDAVKAAIIEYGGLDASVYWAGNSYKGWSNGDEVMTNPSDTNNHGVTLLGWDDNYNNFPDGWVQNPGAFLAYNPAGNSCSGNYLWISYEDGSVLKFCYAYDMVPYTQENPTEPEVVEYQFSLEGLTIDDISYVTGQALEYDYTGQEIIPTVTAFFNTNGDQLFENQDFEVIYENNIDVGTGMMTIRGIGNYESENNIIYQELNINAVDSPQSNDQPEENPGENPGENQGENPGENPGENQGENPSESTDDSEKLQVNLLSYDLVNSDGKNYIRKIQEKTNLETVANSVKTNGIVKIYEGEKEVTDRSKTIKTDMKLIVTKGNEQTEYVLVLDGDTTGDGVINGADLMKISRYVSGADKNLTGAYLIAANVYEPSKNSIDNYDSMKIARYLIALEKNLT